MSEITQPGAQGITAQTITGSTKRDHRRQQEHRLVGPRRDDDLLDDVLQEVGEALQQPPRPDHVRPAPQLHRRPDLAVGVHQEREADEHDDDHRQALRQDQQEEPEAGVEEARPSPYSAAIGAAARSAASRVSSAITSLARMHRVGEDSAAAPPTRSRRARHIAARAPASTRSPAPRRSARDAAPPPPSPRAAPPACRTAAPCPSAADSARRIAQFSRASPGGKPARFAICGRPSVLTKMPDSSVQAAARQDHVRPVRAAVAVAALVDHERPGRHVDLVRPEVVDHLAPRAPPRSRPRSRSRGPSPRPGSPRCAAPAASSRVASQKRHHRRRAPPRRRRRPAPPARRSPASAPP